MGEDDTEGGRQTNDRPSAESFETTLAHLEDEAKLMLATREELANFDRHFKRWKESVHRYDSVESELKSTHNALFQQRGFMDADDESQTLMGEYVSTEFPELPRIDTMEEAADAMEEFNERQQVLLSKMKQKLQQLAKGKA